ncbi:carbonic anhydrase 9-like [Drosophila busckii]|uniref:carbonic anhydrase 9-like n=1 Tax=Drosophila busckii TaxID=30019 RepID=UPI00083EE6BB|nr:carbonic anhydrase 9-like [Drosophila busckii]
MIMRTVLGQGGQAALFILLNAGLSGQQIPLSSQHDDEQDFQRCSSNYQTYRNLEKERMIEKTFRRTSYYDWNELPEGIKVTNFDDTVQVTMTYKPGREPQMVLGPLKSDAPYHLEQFHFHWSNHKVYPAQLHLIMRSLMHINYTLALDEDHGFAVLAFYFNPTERDNSAYAELTQRIQQVQKPGQSSDMLELLPLQSFVCDDLENYYTYVDALTNNSLCDKQVVWVYYKKPIEISYYQLDNFRLLSGNNANNITYTQALRNLTIYKNVPLPPENATQLENSTTALTPFLFMITLLVAADCGMP